MAVAFRSSSNTGVDNGPATTSRAPAVPAGAQAGDVVVVVLTRWTADSAITAPSGFFDWGTAYPAGTGGNTNANIHIFWKRLTGADTGTYTFSWTNNTGNSWTHAHAFCFSGVVSTGTPIEAVNNWAGTAGTFGSTSVTTATIPGLIWSVYNDSSGTHTPPTGFTEVIDFDSGAAAWKVAAASGTQTASGGSVTSSSPSGAVLIALAADTGGATTVSGSDSATVSESASLMVAWPLTDSAAVADSASATVTASANDSAAASEAGIVAATLTGTDLAAVTDTSALDAGSGDKADSDAATLVDSAVSTATAGVSDPQNLTDSAAVSTAPTVSDAASLSESVTVLVIIAAADTQTVSDTSGSTTAAMALDAFMASDAATLGVLVTVADAAALVELAAVLDLTSPIATPPERTMVVAMENRVLAAAAESRILSVPGESRVLEA